MNKEVISTQNVRLLDVFVVAPFLFYAGAKVVKNDSVKWGLYVLGVATLVYNGYNYLKVKKQQDETII